MLAAVAELKCPEQNLAMILEAIPREPGAVVEADIHLFAEEFDEGAGQQRVLQARLSLGPGADDVDGAAIGVQLLADGAEVDEAGDQHALRFESTNDGAGAVAGGEDQRLVLAFLRRKFARRIAQIEAIDRHAAAFAREQRVRQAGRQRLRVVDLGTGANAGAAGGEGVDDGRCRPQHVDDDGDAAAQARRLDQRRNQMHANVTRGHDVPRLSPLPEGDGSRRRWIVFTRRCAVLAVAFGKRLNGQYTICGRDRNRLP